MMSSKTLLYISGPTGIGKTKLSISLAKSFDTEIISCDSRQFYKEMKIGTAVPNQNELLDRQAALRAVWGDDNYFNGRSMDVYIAKLRKLLKEDANIEIMNVHGIGFKLLIKQ